MKRLTKTLLITLILVAICAAFVACDFSGNTKPQPVVSYSVQFAQAEISMTVGDRIVLPAVYVFKLVDGASSAIDAQCTYSISEEDVVLLNSEGKLVALKQGTTTLVAKYQNATAVLVVTVQKSGGDEVKITFDTDCDIPSFDVKSGANGIVLPSVERKGYEFCGWTTPDGIKLAGDNYVSSIDVTLKATWKRISYKITYVLNGGTNSSINPEEYFVDSETIVLQYPQKANAMFLGWYTDAEMQTRITVIAKGTTGDLTLYAKFSDMLAADFVGGIGASGSVSSIVLKEGNQIVLPQNAFSKTGYNFVGWNDGENIYAEGDTYTLDKSTTFTAEWDIIDYNITYRLDGGSNSANNPSIFTVEDGIIELSEATKSGYRFSGWYSDSTLIYRVERIDCSRASDIVLYAKFDLLYDVSFDGNGGVGNAPSTISQIKNGSISLPENTFENVEGFFVGWNDGRKTYLPGETYIVKDNVAFKAQWLGNFEEGTNLFDLTDEDYIIVYQNDSNVKSLAESLQEYIRKVCGVTVSVVCDSNYSQFDYSLSKVISIGNTQLFESMRHFKMDGNTLDSKRLTEMLSVEDSFAIASDRYAVCLIANNSNGLFYAVDQFVEDYLGVRFLTPEVTYIPQKDSAMLQSQSKTYSPEFAYRQYLNTGTFYPSTDANLKYSQHLRFNGDYIQNGSSNGFEWYTDASKGIETAHNTLSFVKPSDYTAYASTMFFKYNGQIIDVCYTDGITASGTIDRSTPAIDTAAEAMYAALYELLANTDKDDFWLSVGQADTNEYCKCSDCVSATKSYNRSGITIRFWNAIIDELEKCDNEKVRNKNYRLVMFAYQYNLFAPVVNGMVDKTCIPNSEHLWVRIAPIVVDRYLALNDENQPLLQRENGRVYDKNATLGHQSAANIYSDWASVTSNLFSWTYAPDFENYFAYTGELANMKSNLTLMKECGVQYAFIQGVFNEKTNVDQYLGAYIMSKLAWNLDADVTQLRNEFLLYYYGENAYEKVKAYYDSFDKKYAEMFSKTGTGSNGSGNVYGAIDDSFYISQMQLLDEAQAAASDDYKHRISELKLVPLFMLAKQNSAYRAQFEALFEELGGVNISESKTMDNYTW